MPSKTPKLPAGRLGGSNFLDEKLITHVGRGNVDLSAGSPLGKLTRVYP
jgi:hypothetical protein